MELRSFLQTREHLGQAKLAAGSGTISLWLGPWSALRWLSEVPLVVARARKSWPHATLPRHGHC